MLFKIMFSSLLALAIVSLSACGGGDSGSGAGESLAQEREAVDCITISNRVISNSCGFAVIVRIFAGAETPITIGANSSANITDDGVTGLISFGACRSPFTPVRRDDGFECL